jgi:hypothetical protein
MVTQRRMTLPPGLTHEMPLEMIQRRPGFALELLALATDGDPTGYGDVRLESVDMNVRLPVEYRADSVVSLTAPDGERVFVIIEIQNRHIKEKIWAWLSYVGCLMGTRKCPVMLVVVCPDKSVAAHYDQPIQIEHSCVVLRPTVVGPDKLPVLSEPEDIAASPELATLGAIAHPTLDTAVAVATRLVALRDDRGAHYYSYLKTHLPDSIGPVLEEIVVTTVPLVSDSFTRIFEARGEARGEARMLHTMLEARGLRLDDEQRRVVDACEDPEQLLRWGARAATAGTVAEVFSEDAGS